MHTPQIIMVVLMALSLGIDFQRHGQPETGHHDAWTSLLAVVINSALLYWGGFYSH